MKRCCMILLLVVAACQEGMGVTAEGEVEQDLSVCPTKSIACKSPASNMNQWSVGTPMTVANSKSVWVVQDDGSGGWYFRLADTGQAKVTEAWKVAPADGPAAFSNLSALGFSMRPGGPLPPPPPIIDWDRLAVDTANLVLNAQSNAATFQSSCPK